VESKLDGPGLPAAQNALLLSIKYHAVIECIYICVCMSVAQIRCIQLYTVDPYVESGWLVCNQMNVQMNVCLIILH
jgi:hypothetical protein